MLNYRMRFVILVAISAVWGLSAASAETTKTWHLRDDADWKALSPESEDDKYLLDVAEIKRSINEGRCKTAEKKFDQLKKDFPEIADPLLNTFVEAEMLRCKGKLVRAVWSYNRFLDECDPDSELYTEALERQYRIGEEFLAGRKTTVLGVFKLKGYAQGIRVLDGISWREGLDDPNGIVLRAAKVVAESYEQKGEFDLAYLKWWQIFETYDDTIATYSKPPPPLVVEVHKQALLGMAQCKYYAYKGPAYDISGLIGRELSRVTGEVRYDSAEACYKEFKARYPEEAAEVSVGGIVGVDQILKEIDRRFVEKQLSIGSYYQRTHDYYKKTLDKKAKDKEINPANLYYQMVIDNWPTSDAAKQASEMLIKNLAPKERKK
jgi:hypothetical protein